MNEYQERFEKISCRSNLTDEQKLDYYLGTLKEELAWDVRLFNPRTVLEATRLAKIKEMSLRSNGRMGATGSEEKRGVMMATRTPATYQDQKGVLGKPRY